MRISSIFIALCGIRILLQPPDRLLHTFSHFSVIWYFSGGENVRKLMIKLYEHLEKKLYSEPTFDELAAHLDKTRYQLYEARQEIKYLKSLIKNR